MLSILWRSLIIWVGVRGVVTALYHYYSNKLVAAGMVDGSSQLTLRIVVLVLLFTTALTVFDTIRRKERFFLANLGIPIGTIALLAAGPPAGSEIVLALIASR